MLVLPDALPSYRLSADAPAIDAASFPIADAVRMSMSIPFFFQPVELVHAQSGVRSTILDGGVLSNFPVWIFDVADRDPARPTFGFRLIGGKNVGSGLNGSSRRSAGRPRWASTSSTRQPTRGTPIGSRIRPTCGPAQSPPAMSGRPISRSIRPPEAWLLESGRARRARVPRRLGSDRRTATAAAAR